MASIKIVALKEFCKAALVKEGMKERHASLCAEALTETDAFGTHSHGTKNLHTYIRKLRVGGANIHAEPETVIEGPSFAVLDAHNGLGMIPSCIAMELACEKAKNTGIGLVTVKNSCHFGAAGFYANIAATRGMIGISISNVDPNMTAPGARGMLLGNNPFAFAVPGKEIPTVFLDIAMSNVASLKVIQAKKEGLSIPNTWIVDKEGLPTIDPSHYPEEGAMQPMAAHKGYGFAIMVDILTGALSGGSMSMMGNIVSWCFQLERPNDVCHTFIAVDAAQFSPENDFADRVQSMIEKLHAAPKAKGAERIFVPGEIEWEKHKVAEVNGIQLPADILESLMGLSRESGIELHVDI
jgi:LDH2 family malate/lactate/ureidoglycolate dehydrogenase